MGQSTFETSSLYLIFAEKLFTLPAAHEMLSCRPCSLASTDTSAWRLESHSRGRCADRGRNERLPLPILLCGVNDSPTTNKNAIGEGTSDTHMSSRKQSM